MVLDIDCPYLLMGGTILALWYFCLRLLYIPANPKGEKQAYYKAWFQGCNVFNLQMLLIVKNTVHHTFFFSL